MNGQRTRPRVLRLITRMNVGGPARHALVLTSGLVPDFETMLAAGRPAAAEGELTDPSISVQHLPLVRPFHPVADARSVVAVRRLVTHYRPAIVHTHMAKAGTVGRLATRSVRPSAFTVHTFHGHVLDGYFRPQVQRAFVEAERRLARHTDALIAVSTEIRDELLDLGIGEPARFHVIPLGLELAPFLAIDRPSGHLRASLGLTPETPLVGVVGRLVPIKDVATLLAAVAPLPGVHLAVIGDGELKGVLQTRACELGIGERVHFTGWWTDIPAAMSDLDLVALTSRNEGTPVALIEAAAAGRAVVATDVGGVRSVVNEGITGLLAPPGDAEQVSRLIKRLVGEPDNRRRMGEAARSHVRSRFGKEGLLTKVRSLYAELLALR